MDPAYLEKLSSAHSWLPGPEKIFNAFSLPVERVKYILIGESPYPRASSANGYAFWDAAVTDLWSPQGMSKRVNRATSLRNFIKMLLVAENLLTPPHCAQPDILQIEKSPLTQTNDELFHRLQEEGFLLLNASLVLHPHAKTEVRKDAKAWIPFLKEVITFLHEKRPQAEFLLFGKIANLIEHLVTTPVNKLIAEHPYNHSFITNTQVLEFFRPLHLLKK